jgi:Ca2+/Na+ antiporter
MITLLPSYDMTFKEKIMILANLILFISFIATLVFRDISFILFAIIVLLLLYYVYLYERDKKKETIEKLGMENINFIDNSYCIQPSIDNPLMNPNMIDDGNDGNNNIKPCNIENCGIKRKIDSYFKQRLYKDVNDIYDRNFSQRQFYTVPASTIPNDQEGFSRWLYYREKTCKENNGNQCFNNIM